MGKLVDWIRDKFGNKSEITMQARAVEDGTKFYLEDFCIQMAVNLIAGVISKCEFKMFKSGKEIKENDYYTLNIEPNINQNADEFWQQVISNLLYRNECLVVPLEKQWVVADSYTLDDSKAKFPNAFKNVTCKGFPFDKTFYMGDVLFFRLNNQNIAGLMSGMIDQCNDLMNAAATKYKRRGGRKGIMSTKRTAVGNSDEVKRTNDYLQSVLKNYYNSENGMFMVPAGMEYTEIAESTGKTTSEITDISSLYKSAVSVVAHAFRIPPALLLGDVLDTSHLLNEFLTFCIDPICRMIETELTRKISKRNGFLQQGEHIKIDTTCIQHTDIFEIAVQADKLISSGLYSIDELRQKISDTELGTAWSQRHWITKNYEDITTAGNEGLSGKGGGTS